MVYVITTVTFSDKYNNFYRLKFLNKHLLRSSELRRMISRRISDLPNNRVDWSSVKVLSEHSRIKDLMSVDF